MCARWWVGLKLRGALGVDCDKLSKDVDGERGTEGVCTDSWSLGVTFSGVSSADVKFSGVPMGSDGACDEASTTGASTTAGSSKFGASAVCASTVCKGNADFSAASSAAAGGFSAGFSKAGVRLKGRDTRIGATPSRDLGDIACAARLSTAATGFAGSEGCKGNFGESEGAESGVRVIGSKADNGADVFGIGKEVPLEFSASSSRFSGFGGGGVRVSSSRTTSTGLSGCLSIKSVFLLSTLPAGVAPT